ncbi:MAG: hypothetical protein COV44_07210 [Deltaproteobacteria bacterium CG11_big_fil_rev_8_21_14_0_20_45_16]|nr:MAG: hypothetical protein COV44_07210 [Deltaproteobacteria bacterium CG11_big_fil_rev_8_21_14_0_20_45_16]
MPKLKLEPNGPLIEAPRKSNLLRVLLDRDIPVGNACGGKGLCASCKLTVLEGIKNLSAPNDTEAALAERNSLQKNERISCQTKLLGDVTITTSYWTEDLFDDKD